jgi:hypothetical protein
VILPPLVFPGSCYHFSTWVMSFYGLNAQTKYAVCRGNQLLGLFGEKSVIQNDILNHFRARDDSKTAKERLHVGPNSYPGEKANFEVLL